jgi:hypothetical protein
MSTAPKLQIPNVPPHRFVGPNAPTTGAPAPVASVTKLQTTVTPSPRPGTGSAVTVPSQTPTPRVIPSPVATRAAHPKSIQALAQPGAVVADTASPPASSAAIHTVKTQQSPDLISSFIELEAEARGSATLDALRFVIRLFSLNGMPEVAGASRSPRASSRSIVTRPAFAPSKPGALRQKRIRQSRTRSILSI